METISGRVRKIRFQKLSWGVFELERGPKDIVIVTGDMPGIRLGDMVDALVQEVHDVKFGKQYKAKQITQKERSGIELFLQQLTGIGPKKAQQIREAFAGLDVFDIIENKPEELRKIAGLTTERIEVIRTELIARKVEVKLFVRCQELGLSPYIIGKIQQHFTDNGPPEIRGLAHKVAEHTLVAVETDPFKLVEVDGVGFLTADKIAQKVGIKGDNPSRCWAAIDWVLLEIENSEGSSVIDANMMMAALKGRERGPGGHAPPVKLAPAVPEDLIYRVLGQMASIGRVTIEGQYIQRKVARDCELSIASEIAMRFGVDDAVRGQTTVAGSDAPRHSAPAGISFVGLESDLDSLDSLGSANSAATRLRQALADQSAPASEPGQEPEPVEPPPMSSMIEEDELPF